MLSFLLAISITSAALAPHASAANELNQFYNCSRYKHLPQLQELDKKIVSFKEELSLAQQRLQTLSNVCYSSAAKEEKLARHQETKAGLTRLEAQSWMLRQELATVKENILTMEKEKYLRSECSDEIGKIWRFADYRVGEFPCLDLECKFNLAMNAFRVEGFNRCGTP